MTELEGYIHHSFGIPHNEVDEIIRFFQPLKLRKGDYYLKAGHRSDRLGFVQSGILREFLDADNKEITKWISTKGYFAVDLHSFLFEQPARWHIQALTDCELWVISGHDYKRIQQVIPEWQRLETLFIGKCFAALEDRIVSHLALSAEERFQLLHSQRPELFNLVPLHYIASMLGITPETLSRLRRKQVS
ncbi:MAG: Crp/Fnr family transcriptional regulator [Bacteroidia bacterium]|jgi:CRP-like cAMP-binding protein|nr:Crp/Fnr family transcriptional regulator [Bacteroidia bacterium]